jgi:hypothetical protein
MATTVAVPAKTAVSERRFHVWMAAVFVVTVFCGFGLNFALGRVQASTLPPLVRFHGMAFGCWILLYLVQCVLVDRGSVALHRRLGWFGAVLSGVVVPLGIITTIMAIQRGAVPFFFPTNIFLVLNVLGLLLVGALVAAAIVLRRRTDWHRRLMYCAALELIAPAFGRLLPMPLLGPWGASAISGMLLLYACIGIGFDLAQYRRVHPAWWWGVGAIVSLPLSLGPIAFIPIVRALAGQLAGR